MKWKNNNYVQLLKIITVNYKLIMLERQKIIFDDYNSLSQSSKSTKKISIRFQFACLFEKNFARSMKEKMKSARGECWTYTELKIFYGLAFS